MIYRREWSIKYLKNRLKLGNFSHFGTKPAWKQTL
jgi:hypothetical protein